ncbi:MAG: PAS domain S-box protein [Desulfobacterales bacterium]
MQRLTDAVRKEVRTAQLLNRTQLLYENIVENSRQMIVRFDENMNVSFVNRAFEQMTGQDQAKLILSNWKYLVHEKYHEDLLRGIKELGDAGGSFSMEMDGKLSKGWLYLTITLFPEYIGGNDKMQWVGFDITEEVVIRRKLEESERDLNAIYNGSPDMMASVDTRTGLVTKCNRTLCMKLEYEYEEIVKKPFKKLFHKSSLEEVNKLFQVFLKTGEIIDRELTLRKKNGDPLLALLNVTAIRNNDEKLIAGNYVLNDLTERNKLLDKLRFIQHGVEMSYVPTLWIGSNANIVYVNKAVCNLLGYAKEELKTMHVWDINPLITEKDWPEKWAWFETEESVVFAGQYITKDREIISVEFQVSNLTYPDGRGYNVVFVKNMERKKPQGPLDPKNSNFS